MSPMRREYESALFRFLKMKKEHSELNHRGHEPTPAQFGFKPNVLDDWEVKQIRTRVERELARTT
jgi:hypothetical protein